MHKGIDLVLNIIGTLRVELSKVNIAVMASPSGCKIKIPTYVSLTNLRDCEYIDKIECREDSNVIYASYK